MITLSTTELKHIMVIMRREAERLEEEGSPLAKHFSDMYTGISMKMQNIAEGNGKLVKIER